MMYLTIINVMLIHFCQIIVDGAVKLLGYCSKIITQTMFVLFLSGNLKILLAKSHEGNTRR